jgi:hypothetical protein
MNLAFWRPRQRSALHYGIPDRLDRASGPLSSIGGLPFRKQIAVGRSSLFWLFSAAKYQRSRELPNQKYEDHYCHLISMLRILAKRRAGPSKPNIVTCSTCFIRRRSGWVFPPLKKTWAGANDIDNSAIIGRAHRINS